MDKYKDRRYTVNCADSKIRSADDENFYINTQCSFDGMQGVIKLAKKEDFKVANAEKPQTNSLETLLDL